MTDPTPPTQPALSRTEWIGITNPDDDEGEGVVIGGGHTKMGYFWSLTPHPVMLEVNVHGPSPFLFDAEERHKIAALCLYQQEFGFTQEDVKLLVRAAPDEPGYYESEWTADDIAAIGSLIARIARLLPPET